MAPLSSLTLDGAGDGGRRLPLFEVVLLARPGDPEFVGRHLDRVAVGAEEEASALLRRSAGGGGGGGGVTIGGRGAVGGAEEEEDDAQRQQKHRRHGREQHDGPDVVCPTFFCSFVLPLRSCVEVRERMERKERESQRVREWPASDVDEKRRKEREKERVSPFFSIQGRTLRLPLPTCGDVMGVRCCFLFRLSSSTHTHESRVIFLGKQGMCVVCGCTRTIAVCVCVWRRKAEHSAAPNQFFFLEGRGKGPVALCTHTLHMNSVTGSSSNSSSSRGIVSLSFLFALYSYCLN